MQLAHRVAQTDPWALRLAKRSVNHTMDTMGFSTAIESCFDMHHLGHVRALAATEGKTVSWPTWRGRRPRPREVIIGEASLGVKLFHACDGAR